MGEENTSDYALAIAAAYAHVRRVHKVNVEDMIDESGLSRSTFYRVINHPERTSEDAMDAVAGVLQKYGGDIKPRNTQPAVNATHQRWIDVGKRICAEFPEDAETLLDNIEEIVRAKILLRESVKNLGKL